MKTKQVKFLDKESGCVLGGILIDNTKLICGCCGSVFDLTEEDCDVELIEIYDWWVDLTETIVGDDNAET